MKFRCVHEKVGGLRKRLVKCRYDSTEASPGSVFTDLCPHTMEDTLVVEPREYKSGVWWRKAGQAMARKRQRGRGQPSLNTYNTSPFIRFLSGDVR